MPTTSSAAQSGSGLLEREPELDLIEQAVQQAVAGRGSTVLVEGPAGIGKSELCAAAGRLAERAGLRCLRCRGSRLERGFSFGAVRVLLAPAIDTGDEELSGLFGGAARLALNALRLDPAPSANGEPVSGEAVLHGLYWLCANVAEREPLMVVVDDAQWVDPPSLGFVSYLSRRLAGLRVALLLAVRSEDPDSSSTLLTELRSDPEATLISLAPLSANASAEVVKQRLGGETSRDFIRACHESSGGNPFLLTALIDHLAKSGAVTDAAGVANVEVATPEAVSAWISARLERLGPAAARLARALAIFGGPTELYLCARLAELDRRAASEAADKLLAADILGGSGPLELAHPLVAETVAASIPDAERSALELRAARLLATEGAPADEVGAHLLATEPGAGEWVLRRLLEAGRGALSGGAPETAIRFLERAAREPGAKQRAELWTALGRAHVAIHPDPANEPVERAFELAASPAQRAESALLLLRLRDTQGRSHEAVPQLEEVIAELPEGDLRDRLEAGLISAAQLHSDTRSVGVERLLAAGARIGDAAPKSFGEASILANLAFGASVTCMGDSSTVLELSRRALTRGWLVAELALVPLSYLAGAITFADRPEEARRMLDDAMAAAREAGALVIARSLAGIRATVTLQTGRVGEAVAEAELARGNLEEETWAEVPVSVSPMLEAMMWRGELEQAERIAATYPLADPPQTPYSLRASVSWAKLQAARGADEPALELLSEIGSHFESMGMVHPMMADWRGAAAVAAHRLGRSGQAAELADSELELARRAASAVAIGRALLTAGRVAGGKQGLELLGQAVEQLAGSESRLYLAEAMIELGSALRRERRRREAREHLRTGLDLAVAGQISALAARARDELERTGLKPRRQRISGPESLTPSERQIAEMATAGKRNREIAQELFLTLRTVETHLTHTYAKLEISSRKELAAALG